MIVGRWGSGAGKGILGALRDGGTSTHITALQLFRPTRSIQFLLPRGDLRELCNVVNLQFVLDLSQGQAIMSV
jgi:hypothetical protein